MALREMDSIAVTLMNAYLMNAVMLMPIVGIHLEISHAIVEMVSVEMEWNVQVSNTSL